MKARYFAVPFLIGAFFFNFYFLLERLKLEINNDLVEVASCVSGIMEKSAVFPDGFVGILRELKKTPLTTLIFPPETINTLSAREELQIFTGEKLLETYISAGIFNPLMFESPQFDKIRKNQLYLYFRNSEKSKNTVSQLQEILPVESCRDISGFLKVPGVEKSYGTLLEVDPEMSVHFDRPLYYPEENIMIAERSGFNVFLMVSRNDIVSDWKIAEETLKKCSMISGIYLRTGADFAAQTEDWIPFSTLSGLKLAVEEFEMPKFPDRFLKTFRDSLIRAHQIPDKIMKNTSPKIIMERFLRASRERNVRFLVISFSSDTEISDFSGFTAELKQELANSLIPLKIRKNESPGRVSSAPSWLRIFVFSLVTVMMFLVTIDPLIHLSFDSRALIVMMTCGLMTGGTFFVEEFYFEKVLAQFIAFFIPVAGYFYFLEIYQEQSTEVLWKWHLKILGRIALFTAITMYGALIICGLFNHQDFFMKIEEFRGVKLSLIIPPLMLTLFLLLQYSTKQAVKDFFQKPVNLLQLFLMSALFVMAGILILRSGNIPTEFIPDFEEKLRALMENVMIARPRFKEFVIGYPFFMMAFCFRGFPRYLFLIISAIGQVSVLNTFMHLHTPLLISLLRTFNGFITGILLGSVLFYAIEGGKRLYWRMENGE